MVLAFKIKISTIALLLFFCCKTFSQLPVCKDSLPFSLLQNNSFEQYSGCFTADYGGTAEGGWLGPSVNYGGIVVNGWNAVWRDREIPYHNYNCRLSDSISVFDSSIFCKAPAKVPMPLPDGSGFIVLQEHGSNESIDEIKSTKTYIATCLQQPLYAGQSYTFSFYFGFSKQNNLSCGGALPLQSVSPYGVAIFGRTDCPQYPLENVSDTGGCLSNFSGWILLGHAILSGNNEWILESIDFTPPVNIYSIAVGPDCTNNYGINRNNQLYYYMDNFVIAPKANFLYKSITAVSGNPCTGNYVLKAPDYIDASYQWYKDENKIPGATSQIYAVPSGDQGSYVVNISLASGSCLNSLPFIVTYSDLNNFSLGKDTTFCNTVQLILDATRPNVEKYFWVDGTSNATHTVTQPGLYWVELTDVNGCTKKDSINVLLQNCNQCKLFVPSAFTPNGDGVNDVFRAISQCGNVTTENFTMYIYNRWGQLIFRTNDAGAGWNGTYNNKFLEADTYIYLLSYKYKNQSTIQQKGTVVLLR